MSPAEHVPVDKQFTTFRLDLIFYLRSIFNMNFVGRVAGNISAAEETGNQSLFATLWPVNGFRLPARHLTAATRIFFSHDFFPLQMDAC